MTEEEQKVVEAKIGEENAQTDKRTNVKLMGSAPTNDQKQQE